MGLQRCLITGGCGFVGSHLACHLHRIFPGLRITALDNFHRRGSRLNALILEQEGIAVQEGDVRDEALWKTLPPCDLVIDAAAEPSVLAGRGGGDADYVVGTNLIGTLHLLEWLRRNGGRLVFLSTSRVYPVDALRAIRLEMRGDRFEPAADQPVPGITPRGIGSGFPMEGPRTLYGATKYASEIMVREYAAQFGLDVVINRCSVLAGPRQMGKTDQGIVALWAARHVYQRSLQYLGYGGRQVRDLLHIDDLAELVALQAAHVSPFHAQVYPVGGGPERSVSLRELTRLCQTYSGHVVPLSEDPAIRPGDAPWIVMDTTETERDFPWCPRRSVSDIVRDTIQWIVANQESLAQVLDDPAERAGG